jgi:hypothetical protein
MDINPILSELKAERNRIDRAIATLESLDGPATVTSRVTAVAKAAPKQAKKRGLTPAGRRRLSAMMKARWAARRKQDAKPTTKATSGRRTMSPAARKRISAMMKKRWAARRKAKTA